MMTRVIGLIALMLSPVPLLCISRVSVPKVEQPRTVGRQIQHLELQGVVGMLTPLPFAPGDMMTYLYDAQPGEQLLLRNVTLPIQTEPYSPITITVYSPSGEQIDAAVNELFLTFTEQGEYRITITGEAFSNLYLSPEWE